MSAYVGLKILFKALVDAKSTGYEAVMAAAAKMDKPFGMYETGYGVKFDTTMQNRRALQLIAQWTARLVGIDVDRIHVLTFGIGTALAGLAGCLLTPI